MFRRCISCQADLGANESLERFPVGRRLAFDAAKGRLWVVCARCAQWNLSPLDERWEAIEEAERLFHDARKRVSTDEIGMARMADGTDLVRIGAPQRPELAAWRYGDRFRRRYYRHIALATGGSVALGGLVVGGVGLGAFTYGSYQLINAAWDTTVGAYRRLRVVARFQGDRDDERVVSLAHLRGVRIVPGGGAWPWALEVPSVAEDLPWGARLAAAPRKAEVTVLQHGEALRIAAALLPHINRSGGKSDDVRLAVGHLEGGDDFHSLAGTASRHAPARRKKREDESTPGRLAQLPASIRLALEMSLHEEDERRWLEGELYELEQRWREAEVIAGIADSLLVPAWVDERIRRR
ncbi:MAG: hypothetical protein HYX65_03060 [Gemmatimonadetes bacterium]|nr:hypothetical protein [Gemmatimonadota bacterium]